eukprot:gene27625-7262_t
MSSGRELAAVASAGERTSSSSVPNAFKNTPSSSKSGKLDFLQTSLRTMEFWKRTVGIYGSYKATQVKCMAMRMTGRGEEDIKQTWVDQHTRAGQEMYDLCIHLRGFYLKAGQFIGSRGDFVPEQVCRKLSLLCDKVPPMSPEMTRAAIQRELGVENLGEVFEWIDMEKPLGSASVSQVHKAKLRTFSKQQIKAAGRTKQKLQSADHFVEEGEGAWDVCNLHGISMKELQKSLSLKHLHPGQILQVPVVAGLGFLSSNDGVHTGAGGPSSISNIPITPGSVGKVGKVGHVFGAGNAVLNAAASGQIPKDGLVAVKIQYPNALPVMTTDLGNLRVLGAYLGKTDLKFDLVSAVDELDKQIRLEFDFIREARVMDTIARNLSDISKRVTVPRSVPGLVTQRLLVMSLIDGTPLTEAGKVMDGLSEKMQNVAKVSENYSHLIMCEGLSLADGRPGNILFPRGPVVSEAYGRMILGEGLFQADGHPGNILLRKGATIGLLDYGQSKQLSDHHKLAFARLIMSMSKMDKAGIDTALKELDVQTESHDMGLRTDMSFGMFDTKGTVNPFDKDSPMKKSAISKFPPDMFFVLRVVQLLRGMANGMGILDFTSVDQWAPYARETLWKHGLASRPLSVQHLVTMPLSLLPRQLGLLTSRATMDLPRLPATARMLLPGGGGGTAPWAAASLTVFTCIGVAHAIQTMEATRRQIAAGEIPRAGLASGGAAPNPY